MTRRDLELIAATRAALADGSARQRREQARIRLGEMAAACGVTGPAVSMWERGLREPQAGHALGYARALAAAERKAA